jgi:CubicO group peptidase (beta-lactamase class C family)
MGCRLTSVVLALGALSSAFLSASTASAQSSTPATDLTAELAQTLAATPVPGAAVAVVHKGAVLLTAGFGLQRVGQPQVVNQTTRFKLASISKSFTGVAVALLVGQGKLKLEDPVKRWLPELRLRSKAHEHKLTLEDLLTHRTGLDLQALDALLWPQPNAFTAKDLLRALGDIKTTGPLRSRFEYSNAAYVLVGEVIARASGLPYHRFVQEQILAPLGMQQGCSFGADRGDRGQRSAAEHSAHLAQPHRLLASGAEPVRTDEGPFAHWPVGVEAAAGGLRCNAASLAQWVKLFADPSTAPSPALADAARLAATPRALVGGATPHQAAGRFQSNGYGLGVESTSENGAPKLFHFGGLAGISAYMAIYPQQRSGYVVAINAASMGYRQSLSAVVEKALGVAALSPAVPAPAAPAVPAQALPAASSQPVDTGTWRRLAGVYRSNWWGRVSLCTVAGVATATVHASPRLLADVRSGANGQTQLLWRDVMVDSDAALVATPSAAGRVKAFVLKPVAESDFDFSYMRFVRVADCEG